MNFERSLIKIGKSEVEIIMENGIRNYANLAEDSDIVITFHTSLGELDVRLYPDKKDKDLIRVEVKDQERFKKLNSGNKEIGKNCRLGGLSVKEAIEQGSFAKYGEFETICSSSLDHVLAVKVRQEEQSLNKVPVAG